MTEKEMLVNVALELYSQINKNLKEKGLTEEVLNSINTLLKIFEFDHYL